VTTIEKAIHETIAVTQESFDLVVEWRKIYDGFADWLKDGVINTGAAKIYCGEIARNVTTKLETEIQGNDKQNEFYQAVVNSLRDVTEKVAAVGEILLLPNVTYTSDGFKVFFTIAPAGTYYPLQYDVEGRLQSVTLVQREQMGKSYYTLITVASYSDGRYSTESKVYKSSSEDNIGTPINIDKVDMWAHIEDWEYPASRPWFIEFTAPNGESCFANSIDLIRMRDLAYARILTELDDKRNVTIYDKDALDRDPFTGAPIVPQDRKFMVIDDPNWRGVKVESFRLEIDALYKHLDQTERLLEVSLGCSFGMFSEPPQVYTNVNTTQQGRQRFYVTVESYKHQLQLMLEQFAIVLDEICQAWGLPSGNDGISFDSPDSVLITEAEQRDMFRNDWAIVLQAVRENIISREKAVAFLNEFSDFLHKLSPEMIEEAKEELAAIQQNEYD